MKKSIKLLLLIVVLSLAFSVLATACGKKANDPAADITAVSPTPTPTPSPTPTPEPEAETMLIGTVVNVDGAVNIRSGPSVEADVVGQADLGTTFTVLKEFYTSEWHKINFNNEPAYIYYEYLDIQEVPVE